ncbi:DUF4097 family beta strand repeat-containing protein [Streptosporangium sp. NBC_01756]|uniref:DUF4097 family beta strand repeat-containing protein n=1 Tax=Streptosporangium sp. NBC_01756 TaxID=2975950 RepID=UPI002DD9AC65|nr:DUF4097 family beta strand repeat-containing protein [Streptosporangium sp. NBC_01756]WSC88352.1 DUF4097 domain-containing protein [Streptosporangium sp. NBC_01756]
MPVFPAEGPVTLHVQFPAGDLDIAATRREDAVVEVRPANPSRSADVRFAEKTHVEYVNGTIHIEAPERPLSLGRDPRLKILIGLPERSRVEFATSSANARMTGPLGDVSVRTSSGDTRVSHCAAFDVNTSSGDVTCDVIEGDARLKSSSGDIELGEVYGTATVGLASGTLDLGMVGGAAGVKTSSGNVRIGQADGSVEVKSTSARVTIETISAGDVSVTSSSGNVRIGRASGSVQVTSTSAGVTIETMTAGDVSVTSSSGNVRIGRASGSVQVKSTSAGVTIDSITAGVASVTSDSGNVRVGVAEGTSAWLDVSSTSGKVASSLEQADKPDDGERAEIHVQTGSGSVAITRAHA